MVLFTSYPFYLSVKKCIYLVLISYDEKNDILTINRKFPFKYLNKTLSNFFLNKNELYVAFQKDNYA